MNSVRYRGWTIRQPDCAVRLDGETSEDFVRRQALCAMWDLDTRCGYGSEVVHIARYVKRLEGLLKSRAGSGERRSDFDPAATAAPDEASPATAPLAAGEQLEDFEQFKQKLGLSEQLYYRALTYGTKDLHDAWVEARWALLDQYAALQRRAEANEQMDWRDVAKLLTSKFTRAAPDQETVAEESVEGTVQDSAVAYDDPVNKTVGGWPRPTMSVVPVPDDWWPIGSTVTVTKRRRAQDQESK